MPQKPDCVRIKRSSLTPPLELVTSYDAVCPVGLCTSKSAKRRGEGPDEVGTRTMSSPLSAAGTDSE